MSKKNTNASTSKWTFGDTHTINRPIRNSDDEAARFNPWSGDWQGEWKVGSKISAWTYQGIAK